MTTHQSDIIFNFVIDCTESALAEYTHLNLKEAHKVFVRGDLNWCLQTYLTLKKRTDLRVICSNKMLENCINIVHSDTLLFLKGNHNTFIVCVRADYPKRLWAHYHIVQNKKQPTKNTSFISHWVQPSLVKRSPNRKGVTKVAYAGQTTNGNLAGTADAWKRLFEPYQIEFVTLTEGEWHNLEDVDVLIGIRSFDTNPYNTKPPTKLFNAWHANIPFIGGHDSGFRQVGTPNLDYLIATSPEEAVKTVLQLRDNPKLYEMLVRNGEKKAMLFTEETITNEWVDVLSTTIIERFNMWKSRSLYERLRHELLLSMSVRQQKSKDFLKRFLHFGQVSPVGSRLK